MITYSIIKKSQLEEALRLDAEYYQPEYLGYNKKLLSIAHVKLGEIAFVTDGEHGSPIFDENSGIKYFSAQHPQDGFIDSEAKMISKIIDIKNRRSSLKVGDVLLSTVGTIGNAGIVTKDLLPANIDRHVARIALNKRTINPEFLIAFLISKFGKFQSIRESTGNVQLNLFIDKIKDLIIPSIEDINVTKLMQQSLSEREKSKSLYLQVENLLLDELGLKDFDEKAGLWSIVNLSETEKVYRIDAEYFQPKYEKLILKIKSKKPEKLENFIKNHSTGFPFQSENYQETGIPLIRINNIRKGYLDLSNSAYLTEKDYLLSPKDVAKPRDIILSMSGSIGMTALVPKDIPKSAINQRILRMITQNIEKDYLVLLLNSIVGSYQLERIGTGGLQTNISYKDIKKILIPVLPKPIQEKISKLVQKSYIARKRSKELLEEAKHKIEELIENS